MKYFRWVMCFSLVLFILMCAIWIRDIFDTQNTRRVTAPQTALPDVENGETKTSLAIPNVPTANSIHLNSNPININKEISSISNKIEIDLEMQEHIASMKAADRELYSKWDLSESDAKMTATMDLMTHCMNNPTIAMFNIYDDPKYGIKRALQSSPSLQELVKRPDFAVMVAKYYNSYPYSPNIKSMKDIKQIEAMKSTYSSTHKELFMDENKVLIGIRSFSLCQTDEFLQCEFILKLLAGHEREILQALIYRYDTINEIRTKRNRVDDYNAASAGAYNLSRALLKQINPALTLPIANFASTTWEKDFYEEIRKYTN